jgi:hypothetical protein
MSVYVELNVISVSIFGESNTQLPPWQKKTDVSVSLLEAIVSPIHLPLSLSTVHSPFLKLHSICFLVYEVAFSPQGI